MILRSRNRLFLHASLLPCWRVWPRLLVALAVAPLARMEAGTVNFGGTQTLNAPGGGDDLVLLTNATVTLGGAGSVVVENSLTNESSNSLTGLTIDNADASLRALVVGATTLANSFGGRGLSISGSADFWPGILSDNGSSNVQLVKDGGSGELILDNSASSLGGQGTLLRVISGTLSIEGGGGILSPISSLSSALQIDGASGKLRLGTPSASGTVFNNSVLVNASGTLEHSAASADTLGGSVTIAAGTLNANITAGSLAVTGTLFGAGLAKNGGGELRFTNVATLDALAVNGGRLEFGGVLQMSFIPVIASGATLALTSGAGTSQLPAVFTLPSGTLELVPGGLGADSNKVSLTGGTLKLAAAGTLTNGVTAAGNSGIAVGVAAAQLAALTLQPGTMLNKSAGALAVSSLVFASAGTYTLGVTGGDFTVAASAGSGAVNLVKTGAGTLNLNGLQGYQTLDANGGITNVNSSFTGGTATINANATTNFAASQTLAALNVGTAPAALVSASVVPEPASWGLLCGAAGFLLSRRRRS